WRDPIHLRVAGQVEGVCGPHAEVGNLLIRFDILEVDLSFTDCPLVGVAQPHPFVAEMDLGLLADRDWKIVVHDARSPDPLSTSLRVYDLPTVGVTLRGLAVAGQLIHLGITSYSNGGQASVDVRPGIVSVHYEDLVP